ncbi:hypothetical protein [Paenibacillus wynnii]|uniref:hypothetical protein n=1 Tax=Paenibacillus wynnii TaxID=268407 RepID=UPI0027939F1B|nr:hypothetical protein [Paenibacillus wynnii]MDQ0193925.1 hypothetical protein [Paenibacillus wynnii]
MIAYESRVIGIIYTIAAIILICFVNILFLKSRKIWMEKKINKYLLKFQDYFTYIQAQIDSDDNLMAPQSPLNSLERVVLQKKLIEWIHHFKGGHREKLIKLCGDMELIKLDLKYLHSPLPWRRLNAVYNLGAMRSNQAMPRLLKLLEANKYDPIIFIIARSIAKCASTEDDLREMVLLLVRHRKNVHHLIVDIIKESEIDSTPLMMEFLMDDDYDLIKIALVGMPVYMESNIVPRLYRLLDFEDEEIRTKATGMLNSNNRFLPPGNGGVQDEIERVLLNNQAV